MSPLKWWMSLFHILSNYKLPMTRYFFAIGVAVSAASCALATVTLNINIDGLRNAGGEFASYSSLVLLVADMDGNGFTAPVSGFSTTASSTWGDDDRIVARFDGSIDEFDGFFASAVIAADLYASKAIALYWFPSLTLDNSSLNAGVSYGTSVGTLSWIAPAVGGTLSYDFLGANSTGAYGTGVYTNAQMSANFTVAPIPEPSAAVALAGAAILGVAATRRRRRAV